MVKKLSIIVALLLILAAVTTGLLIQSKNQQRQLEAAAASTNKPVLTFTKNFIDKVLKAEKEVDFDSRLKLENDVRELKDEAILAQWQKFTGSKTELEAQTAVKDLLALLVSKL